jgi:hypothetical protein
MRISLSVINARCLFDKMMSTIQLLVRLHDDPALRPALTAAGRDLLHRRHDPAAVAAALAAIYSEAG